MFSSGKIKDELSNPNSLTLYRILLIPAMVVLLMFPNRFFSFLAAVVFSIGAITDWLDGYFARRKGLVSNFGKIMDPIADKLLVSSAFIMLISHGWIDAWMVCIIIAREIAVTGLRNILIEKAEDVSASRLGKYKTGFQIGALIPLMLHYTYLGIDFQAVGSFILWGALVLTVWSGADYFIRFRRLLIP